MYYAEIKNFDVANGPGVRVSLFVSGCPHACPGCFNEIAWNYRYGAPFTEEVEEELLSALEGRDSGLEPLRRRTACTGKPAWTAPLSSEGESAAPEERYLVLFRLYV